MNSRSVKWGLINLKFIQAMLQSYSLINLMFKFFCVFQAHMEIKKCNYFSKSNAWDFEVHKFSQEFNLVDFYLNSQLSKISCSLNSKVLSESYCYKHQVLLITEAYQYLLEEL